MICEIHSFVKSIYVTSFLSISCLSNSEYWSQKTSQSGNNISPHWLNEIYLKILTIALILYWLGNGLRTLNTLS